MKKKANRALSLLLSVVMCIGLLPASAFAAGQSGDTIYVKMTAPPEAGDQVIITNTDGTQALTYTTSTNWGVTSNTISAVSVTPDSNGVITDPGSAKVWTVSGSGSRMKFQNEGNYLSRSSSIINTSLAISKTDRDNTWTVTSNQMYYTYSIPVIGEKEQYLGYSSNSFTLSKTKSTIAFYKAYTVAADPVTAPDLTYNGTDQVLVKGGTGYTLTSTGSKVASIATNTVGSVKKGDAFAANAGSYQITATLNPGYAWSDGTTAAKVIDVTISKDTVTAPTAVTGLTYTGQAQTIVAGNDRYTLSCSDANAKLDNGSIKAVNAGEYTVTATLNDEANYAWATAFDGNVTATIAKANASITPANKEVMKGAFTDADLPTAAVNGVCNREIIGYVIVVTDKDGKVINTLGADSKTYEPVTADQLNALVVGEYTLSIQLLTDDASAAVQANYNLTTSGTAALTVGSKTSDVQVWDDANQKFVKNENTSGLKFISGTNAKDVDCAGKDASGDNLVVKVLSQGDPITATTEAGLVLADNESVIARFEVNLYLNGVKMNTGATLNKKIQVQVPVDAKDGEYEIAHWDGAKYTRLTENGIVANGILTFATDTFSPFVMIGTTTYVKMIGTPADEEGYTVTFVNTNNTVIVDSDGTALSEKGEAYVFTVTAKPGYQIVSVTDNGEKMTPVGSTYTIPAADANTNHKIVVTASPADVSLTIVYGNGTADDTATYPYGVSVNLPGAPTKTGYTFAGWLSTKENKTYGAGDPFTPTVDDTLTAVWVADITVSYNVDGSTIPSDTVAAGDSVLLPAAPTHADKVFTGWKSANTGAIFAAETLYTPAANDTLTAQWTAKYVITVKPENNDAEYTIVVIPGANATVPDAPTKSGYVFVGWYSTANAQTYAPGYLYTPAGDDTLTARWAQLYTVTYDANGGSTAPSESAKVAGAEFIVKGAELTKTGYTFVGWKSSATGVIYQPGAFYTMTAEDTTFTAQWEKVATYTVTYAANGGTGTDVVDTTEYYELDTVSVKDNTWTAPAGKVFAGWKSSVDGTIYNEGDSFNMPGMDVVLTAQWADVAATYTVTYNANGGSGTVPTETDKVAGAEFAVKASELTKTGYIFAGWKSDQDGAIYQPGDNYTMTAAATKFTAQWKEVDKYTVTYNVDGKTTIDSDTYAENALYTVTRDNPSKTGYIFTGWRSSVNDVVYAKDAQFPMPAQNVTLIATWVEEDAIFRVTYDMNGATSAQIADTKDYKYAEVVKVKDTTPTKADYTFAGWLRSDNGEIVNAGDNINMPACNLTLTAQWNAVVKYTVNYELMGGTAATPIAPGEYLGLAQATVTQTVPTKDGYRFMGWLDKTTGIEYASGETFTMPEKNITLTAQWAKEYTVKFDLNDGGHSGNTTPAVQKVVLGDKLTSVGAINDWKDGNTPSKDYYFCGWKNQNGTYWSFEYDVVDDGCFVDGVMTLTAQWDTVKRYNIVFDDNLVDPLDDYVTIDGNVVASGTKQIDNIAANTKLTDSQYPDFARVDYILGVDNTKNCDWYLDANYTFAYDATDTLAGNDADRYAKPDGTLVLYAKWTAKYDARGDVKMDAASLAETGTYNTYYSDWVEAWEVADIIQPDRVYRNFYVINGTLPDGLKLNKRTGEIYGVPNKVGTYTFTLAMTNDEGRFISETQDFTITIKEMQLKVDRDGTIYNKIYGNADPAKLLKALNIVVKVDGSGVLANSDTYNFGGTTTKVTFSNEVADQQFSLAYDYTGANNANTTNHGLFTGAATKAQLLNNLKYADAYATMASTTDVFTAGTVRQDGEDAGTYKISLANDALTAANKAQYAITIEEEFNNPNKAVAPATDTAKYIFTIDKATLTIGKTGYNPTKIYGENDPNYADITFSTLTVPNASAVTKALDSNKVTIAFTGTGKAEFTDVVNIDLQRVPGEDNGDYQLYLAAENVTGTSTTKTATDAADPINNYNIVIEASMTKDDPANTNKLSINTHAVTFTPDAATITYGDLKVAEDVAVAGSLATKDTATYGLANNAGIGVKDTMTVKVNNVNDYKSKAGYLKAGTYADTDTPEAILFTMTNGADQMGTADADTLDNYVIGYNFTVDAKELTVAGQDVNVTKGSAPTAANIAALAKLNDGVLTGDDVTLTVASYTYGRTTYVNTDAGVADLIAAIGTIDADKTVTVNCTLTGADAANYTLAAGNVDATLKAYTASSGGGGGGGGVVTYAITVNSAENGSVTSSSKSAAAGATVTLTVKPDTGYTLETLTVTNAKGNEVSVTEKDGKYTFTMPASKVTVTATFMEDNTVLNFFVDVPVDAYYYEAVRWAVVNGITSGTSATTFSPNASCTRAQIVTFLWRAAGSPAPESDEMPFVDVPADAYYYDAVLWAVENGITSGTSATTFSPNATCTRAQSVTFLWRAQGSPAVEAESIFTDVADDVYYAEAVLWAVEEGITNGTSSTTFSPNDDCTRAQIVTFIWRALAE